MKDHDFIKNLRLALTGKLRTSYLLDKNNERIYALIITKYILNGGKR